MYAINFANNYNKSFVYQKTNIRCNTNDTQPTFKGISSEASDALKSQQIATQNIQNKKQTEFTDKDINFSYTCGGYEPMDGNTREVFDNRPDWYKDGRKIKLLYDSNGDKWKGPSTTLIFPLPQGTKGVRNGDNMTMLINGHIPIEDVNKMLEYMKKYNVEFDYASCVGYNRPNQPNLRKNVAVILNMIQQEKVGEINTVKTETDDSKPKFNISKRDINIVDGGHIQDKDNSRIVKDYLREFMNAGGKRTIIHDKFVDNDGNEKDTTVLLIPQGKESWDYAALAIDANIPDEEYENMIKYMSSRGMTNNEDEKFKDTIIEYLNK